MRETEAGYPKDKSMIKGQKQWEELDKGQDVN